MEKKLMPPQSEEAEKIVLGCAMNSADSLSSVCELLDGEDFYVTSHKTIFDVLKRLYSKDRPADVGILQEELTRSGKVEGLGGARDTLSLLMYLSQHAGVGAHITEYARIVKKKSTLRRIIEAAQKAEKMALEDPDDVDSLLESVQKNFSKIGSHSVSKESFLLGDLLRGTKGAYTESFMQRLEARQEDLEKKRVEGTESLASGVCTRFHELDMMINGLGQSNLIILAARPAMGKTALGLNIAENVCFQGGMPVGVFSLEMSAEQLITRLVSSQSGVESSKIQRGDLSRGGEDFQKINETVQSLIPRTLVIDDQPGISITHLMARARRMSEAYGIRLLIIDYLQLITGTSRGFEGRQNEVSEISRMLKTLARELHIPVLCLSQLSRKVEERQGHKPTLSDLRESGSIEQDADVVCFLLRRDYYDPQDKPGLAELIVAKNRHGAVGDIEIVFKKEVVKFLDAPKREKVFKQVSSERDPYEDESQPLTPLPIGTMTKIRSINPQR